MKKILVLAVAMLVLGGISLSQAAETKTMAASELVGLVSNIRCPGRRLGVLG